MAQVSTYLPYHIMKFNLYHLQDDSYFTLHDLKGSKLSGSVFNILFNLNKFMAFETRDPFLIRQVKFVQLGIFILSSTMLGPWSFSPFTFQILNRSARTQIWQSGTALPTENILDFQWRKMPRMPLMEVRMFGMNHLRLLFESFSERSPLMFRYPSKSIKI